MAHIKIVKVVNYLAIVITSQSKEKVGGCGLKVRQKGPKNTTHLPSPSLSTPPCPSLPPRFTHPPYLLRFTDSCSHRCFHHRRLPPPIVSTAACLLPSTSVATSFLPAMGSQPPASRVALEPLTTLDPTAPAGLPTHRPLLRPFRPPAIPRHRWREAQARGWAASATPIHISRRIQYF